MTNRAGIAPAPQPQALVEDRLAAGTVHGAVDPAPAEQGRVRGVDDGVDLLDGEVAEHGVDLGHVLHDRPERPHLKASTG
jgi:hypothetical protein